MLTKLYVGKENAKKVLNKAQQRYSVYWFDPNTLKRHNMSYARWWWEVNKGEIPEGYRASFVDGNAMNIDPDNIVLRSWEEEGKIISQRLMGHSFSDETRKKMSEVKKGKPLSDEHKQNIGKATKEMWERGVFDAPEIRKSYRKQGLATKGSKRTEEQKDLMRTKHKGKQLSDKCYSAESIEKRRKKLIGRHQSDESNKKRSDTLKGRTFSDEHLDKLSIAGSKRIDIRGANSKWWINANSDPYPPEFNSTLKRKVRKLSKYLCQSCGENVYGSKRGHVHHIDGNKPNCDISNLILLCATCHNAVHSRNTITSPKIEELKSKLLS